MSKRYCPNCGEEVTEEYEECHNCGLEFTLDIEQDTFNDEDYFSDDFEDNTNNSLIPDISDDMPALEDKEL